MIRGLEKSLQACLIAAFAEPAVAQTQARCCAVPPGEGFVENRGQWPAEELFVGRLGDALVRVRADEFWVQTEAQAGTGVRGDVVAVDFGNSTVMPRGLGPSNALRHFLLGSGSETWLTNVPSWPEVEWADSPVGLRLVGSRLGLRTRSGAVLRLRGLAGSIPIQKGQAVEIPLGEGQALRVEHGGAETRVTAEHDGSVSLHASTADGDADSGSWWITYLGGAAGEANPVVAFDDDGAVVAAGDTLSLDFPTTTGPYEIRTLPPRNVFVTKYLATGELSFSTVFGGAVTDEYVRALDVAQDGAIVFCGRVSNPTFNPSLPSDFPVSENAYDQMLEGADGYVARLSATGDVVLASTFLGGNSFDEARSIALRSTSSVIVVGTTFSATFPVTPGSWDSTLASAETDAFATELTADLTDALFSTYVGGVGAEAFDDVAIAQDGSLLVAGSSTSPDYPTTPNALQPSGGGGVVTTLSATGDAILASTCLNGDQITFIYGVECLLDGSVVVAGWTSASDLPTTPGSLKPTSDIFDQDAFVFRLDAALSQAIFGTYVGGTSGLEEFPVALAVTSAGAPVLVGRTISMNFPTTPGSLQPSKSTKNFSDGEGYIAMLHPDGSELLYSTYLGASGSEAFGDRVGVDIGAAGDVAVAIQTASDDFPTTPNAAQPQSAGLTDALVALLPLLPTGVTKYGTATVGPAGAPWLGVLTWPQLGNARFGITCTDAPPNGLGLLLLASDDLVAPAKVKGVDLWVNPGRLIAILPIASGDLGWAEAGLPIPGDPVFAGLQVFVQTAWLTGTQPPLAASNALAITVQ